MHKPRSTQFWLLRLGGLLVGILWASTILAQRSIELRTVILDSVTREILPFANAFNLRRSAGTAANEDGLIVLPNNQIGDTVAISYVGYRTARVRIERTSPAAISLAPNVSTLGGVVVLADDDYLFDILRSVRRRTKTDTFTAKTYLFVETKADGKRAELIEGYYNGLHQDHKTVSLAYKKSRVGLRLVNGRVVTSTSTSRLFTISSVFESSPWMPDNPLCVSKRKAKGAFELQRVNQYNENGTEVIVIEFTPLDSTSSNNHFSGTVWVDRTNYRLLKVVLDAPDTKVHPFLVTGNNEILQVDLHMERTFVLVNGQPVPEQTTADYEIKQRDVDGDFVVRTRTFTKAYDYSTRFVLPRFPRDYHRYQDYRDESMAPYDANFWGRTREFRFYDRLKDIEDFVRESGRVYNHQLNLDEKTYVPTITSVRHLSWNKTRVSFRGVPPQDPKKRPANIAANFDAWYEFRGNLYLDLYELPDGRLHYQTAAVLDPLFTSYSKSVGPAQMAFYNIQFDLLEIQRRELEKDLNKLSDLTRADAYRLHQKHVEKFKEVSGVSTQQMLCGTMLPAVNFWSGLVKRDLGVDNVEYFCLDCPQD